MATNTKNTPKPWSTITVSIPNDGQPHQLLPLMFALDPHAPVRGKYVVLQNDPITSTANAFLGEGPLDDQGAANPSVVTTTNRLVIAAGESETFGGWWDEYNNLARYWVINDASATGVLNITIQVSRG